jgi:hypothetical protein
MTDALAHGAGSGEQGSTGTGTGNLKVSCGEFDLHSIQNVAGYPGTGAGKGVTAGRAMPAAA